jgi:transcriptional regulator with XRE-family HTH domain
MGIGENIKKARLKAGLTQQELGDRLNVKRQALCNWENGYREPRTSQLEKIADALGVTIDSLAKGIDTPNTNASTTQDRLSEEEIKARIGERIKKARLKAGLTQQELGNMVNVKPQTVGGWERAQNAPRMGQIGSIAAALNVSVDYLLAGLAQYASPVVGQIGAYTMVYEAPINYLLSKLGMLDVKHIAAVEAVIDGFIDSPKGKRKNPDEGKKP